MGDREIPDGWLDGQDPLGNGQLPYEAVSSGLGSSMTKEEFERMQAAIIQFAEVATPLLISVLQRREKSGLPNAKVPGIDVAGLALYPPDPGASPHFFFHFYLKPPEVDVAMKLAIYRQPGEVYTSDVEKN